MRAFAAADTKEPPSPSIPRTFFSDFHSSENDFWNHVWHICYISIIPKYSDNFGYISVIKASFAKLFGDMLIKT